MARGVVLLAVIAAALAPHAHGFKTLREVGASELQEQCESIAGATWGPEPEYGGVAQMLSGASTIKRPCHLKVTSGGAERDAVLHLPNMRYDSELPPLVLLFHPHHNATQYATLSTSVGLDPIYAPHTTWMALQDGFGMEADERGWMLMYVQRLMDPANPGFPAAVTADEVGVTEAFLGQLSGLYDEGRVFAAGMSAGAHETYHHVCAMGGKLAAAGIMAGWMGHLEPADPSFPVQSLEFDDCDVSTPVPILIVHGDADGTVGYDGKMWTVSGLDNDEQFQWAQAPTTPTVAAKWVEMNGCEGEELQEHQDFGGKVVCESACTGRANVTLCTVKGGGHVWAGSPVNAIAGWSDPALDVSFSTTAQLAHFFAAQGSRAVSEDGGSSGGSSGTVARGLLGAAAVAATALAARR